MGAGARGVYALAADDGTRRLVIGAASARPSALQHCGSPLAWKTQKGRRKAGLQISAHKGRARQLMTLASGGRTMAVVPTGTRL